MNSPYDIDTGRLTVRVKRLVIILVACLGIALGGFPTLHVNRTTINANLWK